jgi:hypothetical protein
VSSYTPTLTALLRAQEGAHALARDQVQLLAISAQHAQDPRCPPLPCVPQEQREVLSVVAGAGASGISDAAATSTGAVLDMIKSANMVHFACHGHQHRTAPHNSHFCLTTGNLSVSELMAVDLQHAFFAFLSACETAKGDPEHADEGVHLAATMLFAGFKSVVATMWCVAHPPALGTDAGADLARRAMNDADGPFVARRFYGRLFEGGGVGLDDVPYALDDAVAALRAQGAPPERWATFIHMGA